MPLLICENNREQPQSLIARVGIWAWMSQSGVGTAGKCVDFLFGTQGMTLANKLSNKITLNIIVNAFFKKAK